MWSGAILLIATVAAVSAALEVVALTLLVLFAKLTAENKSVYVGNIGLLGSTVELRVQQLILIGSVVVAVRLALQLWSAWLEASIGSNYRTEMRKLIVQGYLRASWEKKADTRASDLQNMLMVNVERAVNLLNSLSSGVASLGNVSVLLISALLLSPVFALVLGAAGAGIFLVLRPLTRWARRATHVDADLNMTYSHEVVQTVKLSKEIDVFGVVDEVDRRTTATAERTRRSSRIALLAGNLLAPLYQNVVLLLAFGALAAVTVTGIVQVEVLGITVLLMLRMASYTQGLQSVYHHVVGKSVYLQQINECEARYRAQRRPEGTRSIDHIDRIAFHDVSFSYAPDSVALRELTLQIEAGEMIGIIGPSGAGKSTLTRLLLGLHSPTSGMITANGVPLSDLTLSSWHRRVAYVPQDPQLLDGTVTENIRFFRDEISQDRLEAAAKLAFIHDAVMGPVGGYEARLGDGVGLSGGERQRLCIARALAGEPDLLILDEPTSALDAVSEAAIQRTLKALHGKVTTIIVAHRLSTLEHCDRLLVLRGGRIEAFDSPARIAATNQFFREAQRLMRKEAS